MSNKVPDMPVRIRRPQLQIFFAWRQFLGSFLPIVNAQSSKSIPMSEFVRPLELFGYENEIKMIFK